MALTKSIMVELGSQAPEFSLVNTVTGKIYSSPKLGTCKGMLVMFICNHCPFVKHVAGELAKIGNDYKDSGIEIVAISSNDPVNYPDDSPEKMKLEATQRGYSFPYLFDDSQTVAREFGAVCTPDFFLFDDKLKLVYRGQLDESSPGNGVAVSGSDLRAALNAVKQGAKPSLNQNPSMGCNIKWR